MAGRSPRSVISPNRVATAARASCSASTIPSHVRQRIPFGLPRTLSQPAGRVYSPASIGKAYLRAMGVRLPTLVPDTALSISVDEALGFAMETYHGGRSEARVRKVPAPVASCEVRSITSAHYNLSPRLFI